AVRIDRTVSEVVRLADDALLASEFSERFAKASGCGVTERDVEPRASVGHRGWSLSGVVSLHVGIQSRLLVSEIHLSSIRFESYLKIGACGQFSGVMITRFFVVSPMSIMNARRS